jgi:hypothetical protein
LITGMPTRHVPPSGFDYPLDGLLPLIPCRFSFTPAALMGFTLRRFRLPEGIRGVTTRKNPHTVWPSGIPAAEAPGRPDRRRFLGFVPSRSPWQPSGFLPLRPLEPPLGLTLPGQPRESLGRDFARPPLTRFSAPTTCRRFRRRPRVSLGLHLAFSAYRTEVRIRRRRQPS